MELHHRIIPSILILAFIAAWSGCAAEPAAAPAVAQPEIRALQDAARAKLLEEDPLAQSWGAWLAAEHRLADLAPLLGERLALALREDAPPKSPRQALVRALVDALVQCRRPAPAAVPALAARGFTTEALLLASFDPAQHQECLAQFLKKPTDDASWLAACNLLLQAKSPELATRSLAALTVTLDVNVDDPTPDGTHRGGGSSRRSVRCGDGVLPRQAGGPPAVLYSLLLQASPGDLVLAPGAMPVFARRIVAEKDRGFGSVIPGVHRDEVRLDCLLALVPTARALALPKVCAKEFLHLDWQNAEGFLRDVETKRREIRERWRPIIAALSEAGLLRAPAANDACPRIQVEITDLRTQKQPPLPELPAEAAPAAPAPGR